MPDVLDEVAARLLKERPWLVAAELSIWHASGEASDGIPFQDCLIYAEPFAMTGGTVIFQYLSGAIRRSGVYINPDRVSRARELVLVDATDPTVAYWAEDQRRVSAGIEGNRR